MDSRLPDGKASPAAPESFTRDQIRRLYMPFALALLAGAALPFSLYAAAVDGTPIEELAALHHVSPIVVRERIEAVRLTVTMQVRLGVNRNCTAFRCA